MAVNDDLSPPGEEPHQPSTTSDGQTIEQLASRWHAAIARLQKLTLPAIAIAVALALLGGFASRFLEGDEAGRDRPQTASPRRDERPPAAPVPPPVQHTPPDPIPAPAVPAPSPAPVVLVSQREPVRTASPPPAPEPVPAPAPAPAPPPRSEPPPPAPPPPPPPPPQPPRPQCVVAVPDLGVCVPNPAPEVVPNLPPVDVPAVFKGLGLQKRVYTA